MDNGYYAPMEKPSNLQKDALILRKHEEIGRKEALKSLLKEFAANTSLLGVAHIYRKRSFFWFVASVITLTMSIFQSWNVTSEFFQRKTTQHVTLRSLMRFPMPSVTMCSHIVLPYDFNFSLIEGYNATAYDMKLQNCKTKNDEKKLTKIIRQNRAAITQYLRKLPKAEQIKLSQNYSDFIEDCDFSEHTCKELRTMHYFHNPFYGNCFTFNPGYGPYVPFTTDMHGQLVIHVNIDKGYRLSGKKAKVGVLLHAVGTAPILDSPGVQNLYKDRSLDIALTIEEKSFIKQIKNSKPTCVSNDDEVYRKRSLFYTNDTPYLYSLEACMKTCEQELIDKTCKVINPTLPLQSPEYEARLNTTLPPISLSCEVNENIDTEFCDCPLPCNITTYLTTVDTTDYLFMSCNHSDDDDDDDEQTKGSVTIYFGSTTAERVEEIFVHGWPEFLGFLGGNLSLWTGTCVLSVLELLELFALMIGVFLQRPASALTLCQSEARQLRNNGMKVYQPHVFFRR